MRQYLLVCEGCGWFAFVLGSPKPWADMHGVQEHEFEDVDLFWLRVSDAAGVRA